MFMRIFVCTAPYLFAVIVSCGLYQVKSRLLENASHALGGESTAEKIKETESLSLKKFDSLDRDADSDFLTLKMSDAESLKSK